ncbi:alternative ribosome rescue aminoacyl-tRNA hydrolase ArfB [Streptosporangium sp. NPDC020145]|uniref:alternative ribosome rescue aminoacyl-tRNA hydrolase ArfB n=1 Tax=Streptosporangium sp. NPDC020145 TaxID=3154694 RepID=UPI00342BC422
MHADDLVHAPPPLVRIFTVRPPGFPRSHCGGRRTTPQDRITRPFPSRQGDKSLDQGVRAVDILGSQPMRFRRSSPPMSDPLEISGSLCVPEAELRWRFSRSSGPGGQGVNTTDSRVELSFDLAATEVLPPPLRERALERLGPRLVGGVITVVASEFRSQLRNREAARDRLARLLREAVAPPPKRRRPTKPSRGSVERRITAKKHRSDLKRLRRGDF